MQDLYKHYISNNDFKDYVDKYAIKHNITVMESLKHKQVQNYLFSLLNIK